MVSCLVKLHKLIFSIDATLNCVARSGQVAVIGCVDLADRVRAQTTLKLLSMLAVAQFPAGPIIPASVAGQPIAPRPVGGNVTSETDRGSTTAAAVQDPRYRTVSEAGSAGGLKSADKNSPFIRSPGVRTTSMTRQP